MISMEFICVEIQISKRIGSLIVTSKVFEMMDGSTRLFFGDFLLLGTRLFAKTLVGMISWKKLDIFSEFLVVKDQKNISTLQPVCICSICS